jgi:hypothetical protein
MKIKGAFEVKLNPLETYNSGVGGIKMGRMSLNKTFSGDLTATSKGEMLSAMGVTPGSAGYVALEQVTGTLMGKYGSFALQHYGRMDAGKSSLVLEVVPASGEGELAGLTGKMEIIIEGGKHFYAFDFDFQKS